MFCSNCGKECPDEAKFCEACGTRLGIYKEVGATTQTERETDVSQTELPAQQAGMPERDAALPQQPAQTAPDSAPAAPQYTASPQGFAPTAAANPSALPAKKKRGGLVVLILLLVLAAAAAALCFAGVISIPGLGGRGAKLPTDPLGAFRVDMEQLLGDMPQGGNQFTAVKQAILPGGAKTEGGTNTTDLTVDMNDQSLLISIDNARNVETGDTAFYADMEADGETMTLADITFVDGTLYAQRMDMTVLSYNLPQAQWSMLAGESALDRLGRILAGADDESASWNVASTAFVEGLTADLSSDSIEQSTFDGAIYTADAYTLYRSGEDARAQMLRFVDLMESDSTARDSINEADGSSELTGSRLLRQTTEGASEFTMAITLLAVDRRAIGYVVYADADGQEFEYMVLEYQNGSEEEFERSISHFDDRGSHFHSAKQSAGAGGFETAFEQTVWSAGGTETSKLTGSVRETTAGAATSYSGSTDAVYSGSAMTFSIDYTEEKTGADITGSGSGTICTPATDTSAGSTITFALTRTHSDKTDIQKPDMMALTEIASSSADEFYNNFTGTDAGIPAQAGELSRTQRLMQVFGGFYGASGGDMAALSALTSNTVENELIPIDLTWSTGELLYTGEVDGDGLPNGPGVGVMESDEDGCAWSYDGMWEHGHLCGEGLLTNQSESYVQNGVFLNDQLNGYGTQVQDGVLRYEGDWANGELSGHGTLYTKTGMLLYEGAFENSMRVETEAECQTRAAPFFDLCTDMTSAFYDACMKDESGMNTELQVMGAIIGLSEQGQKGTVMVNLFDDPARPVALAYRYAVDDLKITADSGSLRAWGYYVGSFTYTKDGVQGTCPLIEVVYWTTAE